MNISDFRTKEEEEWEMRYQELKDLMWMLNYTTGNEHEQVRQYLQEGFRQLGFTKEEVFSMIPPR